MKDGNLVKDALKVVQTCELEFERRHTRLGLIQAAPAFAELLSRQRALFDKACVTGSVDAVKRHRDGMVRGYQKAMQIMHDLASQQGEYRVWENRVNGRKIVIGLEKMAPDRVKAQFGVKAIYLTAIEAAELLDRVKAFDAVIDVKTIFPGAEVLPKHPPLFPTNRVNKLGEPGERT